MPTPTALITGASRGIGRGIALELARGGGRVAINYAGNAEAAAEVEMRQRGSACFRKTCGQSERLRLRFNQRIGIERLAPGEDVKPAPFRPGSDHFARQSRHAFSVDAKGLGAAAHLHA